MGACRTEILVRPCIPTQFGRDGRFVVVVLELGLDLKVTEILKNSIQPSWPMRCASPSTPASLRMMSWMDLIVVERDTGAPGQAGS